MAQANYEMCLSQPWAKALTVGSQDAVPLRYLDLTGTKPDGDGVFDMGEGGAFAANRLKIMPYCEGPPGSMFWLRLWGYNLLPGPRGQELYIPELILGLTCWAGDMPGPSLFSMDGTTGTRLISPSENMSAYVVPYAGFLGDDGALHNTGISPASVTVEIWGAQKVKFEFQRDEHRNISMNALWRRV